jgi:hypothetical protein
MKITLAFDIERSGATAFYDTIAIGASVVDENFHQLDSLLLNGYVPEATRFEPRCMNEFWSKNMDILNSLKYTGNLSYPERQAEMIKEFQHFRAKWEILCQENDNELYLVSDNNVYDGGFINDMIFKYLPGVLPIPYTASTQSYESFWETDSIAKGIVNLVDPTYNKSWGFTDRLKSLYELPENKIPHDHNPANDAYCIAYDFQSCNAITSGKIKRKT